MSQRVVEHFSDVVGRIYQSAIEPETWPEALESVARITGSRHALLHLEDVSSGRRLLRYSSGAGPALLAATAWRNTFEFMTVGLIADSDTEGSLVLGRSVAGLSDDQRTITLQLVPHLQRAIAISHDRERRDVETSLYALVMDAMTAGVILTDASLAVRHTSRPARRMLGDGVPITIRNGRLRFVDERARRSIESAIRMAASHPSRVRQRRFGATGADGQSYVFHVAALPASVDMAPAGASSPCVALFIAEAGTSGGSEFDAATLFDLTPSEGRVFSEIAAGNSINAIAARTGVAVSTVRSQLLKVFEKTNCHRQADIVALAAAFQIRI